VAEERVRRASDSAPSNATAKEKSRCFFMVNP
jgi:hypothetical protein